MSIVSLFKSEHDLGKIIIPNYNIEWSMYTEISIKKKIKNTKN